MFTVSAIRPAETWLRIVGNQEAHCVATGGLQADSTTGERVQHVGICKAAKAMALVAGIPAPECGRPEGIKQESDLPAALNPPGRVGGSNHRTETRPQLICAHSPIAVDEHAQTARSVEARWDMQEAGAASHRVAFHSRDGRIGRDVHAQHCTVGTCHVRVADPARKSERPELLDIPQRRRPGLILSDARLELEARCFCQTEKEWRRIADARQVHTVIGRRALEYRIPAPAAETGVAVDSLSSQ